MLSEKNGLVGFHLIIYFLSNLWSDCLDLEIPFSTSPAVQWCFCMPFTVERY